MPIRMLFMGFVLGIAAALVTSQAISQQQAEPREQDEQDAVADQMEEGDGASGLMDAWMASLHPGPNHELLNPLIGEWETTTHMWVAGPERDPITTTGTSTRRWVLGNRFMYEEMNSTFPLSKLSEGQQEDIPWNGMGFFGYDGFRNMYVGAWIESMGTQMLTMKGSTNEAGDAFTYYGEMDEPLLGVIGRMVKYQTRILDENNHVFTIYDLHAGDDYRVVEITYKRANQAQDNADTASE